MFGNDAPLHIEIGMGKGRFLMDMAKLHPEVNYVGIEKYSSVLLRAIQKMEEEELPNVRFIRMDAEEITNVFGRGEVERIYLNFSDPLAEGQACESGVCLPGSFWRGMMKSLKRMGQ